MTTKKKKEGFGSLERGDRVRCRGSGVSYDCFERFLHACGCGIRKSTQSTEDNGSGVFEHMASSTTSPTSACRYKFFFCVSKTQTEFLRGMGGGAFLLHHWGGMLCGSSGDVSSAGGDRPRHVLHFDLFRAPFRQVVGFHISPLSSNGIALPIAVTGATHQEIFCHHYIGP
jgi:hypothetical protein